jgi:hypothetical protein
MHFGIYPVDTAISGLYPLGGAGWATRTGCNWNQAFSQNENGTWNLSWGGVTLVSTATGNTPPTSPSAWGTGTHGGQTYYLAYTTCCDDSQTMADASAAPGTVYATSSGYSCTACCGFVDPDQTAWDGTLIKKPQNFCNPCGADDPNVWIGAPLIWDFNDIDGNYYTADQSLSVTDNGGNNSIAQPSLTFTPASDSADGGAYWSFGTNAGGHWVKHCGVSPYGRYWLEAGCNFDTTSLKNTGPLYIDIGPGLGMMAANPSPSRSRRQQLKEKILKSKSKGCGCGKKIKPA